MLNTVFFVASLAVAVMAAPSQAIPTLKRRSVSSDQNQQILQIHNELRAKYGSQPLVWNYDLEKQAQEYSDSCHGGHSYGAWRGDTPIPYGENIAGVNGLPEDQRVEWMVRTWLAEEKNYDFDNPVVTHNTGHFTQVVWRKSTSVGCGLTSCAANSWTLVCQYNPPGNWISYPSDLTDNVPNPNDQERAQAPTTTESEVAPTQPPDPSEDNDEDEEENKEDNDEDEEENKEDNDEDEEENKEDNEDDDKTDEQDGDVGEEQSDNEQDEKESEGNEGDDNGTSSGEISDNNEEDNGSESNFPLAAE